MFADDNFKFYENERKLFRQVENTVRKGEIARYEQFLLFPQCFQRLVSQGHQKVLLCGNGLTDDKILGLPKLKAFVDEKSNVTQNIEVVFHRIENIVGKEENTGYQHFLLFPQCFQKAFTSSVSKAIIV